MYIRIYVYMYIFMYLWLCMYVRSLTSTSLTNAVQTRPVIRTATELHNAKSIIDCTIPKNLPAVLYPFIFNFPIKYPLPPLPLPPVHSSSSKSDSQIFFLLHSFRFPFIQILNSATPFTNTPKLWYSLKGQRQYKMILS
jgi:hypothetical protein